MYKSDLPDEDTDFIDASKAVLDSEAREMNPP
jgi:hypothetical protein